MANNQFIVRKGLISLDDSQITGSLSVTDAVSASIFSGSFVGDGSQLLGIDGFPFTGSAEITGSLIVVGPITATEFIGDGSQLSGVDGFPFTGSAAISGSLTVDGSVVADSFTGSVQGTSTTASYVELSNVDGFTDYSSSVNTAIGGVLDATTPITATIDDTDSPYTITNETIVIVDSTNGNVTINLPDLDMVVGTPNQRPIIIYKNDYSQNVVFVEPNGSQLVNGTTQDIIVSIQIGIVYNPTSAGWVTEGTSYQSLAELELFFVPRTETGSLSVSTASYVEYTNVANKPSLVSGSSQISFNGITDKPTLVSGSSQIIYSGLTGIPSGIVSGSEQITYSGLTGTPSGIVSSSAQVLNYGIFATTGSNGFNGNQSITGSLTVTGQVVAQTLNVQQVTSSIVYSSGSNIFGNNSGNTHSFTGSLGVTGSLSVNGTSAVVGSGTTNYIPKFTGSTAVGNSIIQENATGIGINVSPAAELQVGKSSDVTIAMSNSSSVTSGNRGSIAWYNSSVSTVANIRAVAVTDNVGTELQFYTRPAADSLTQVMTLDSSGNVGIGTTSNLNLGVTGTVALSVGGSTAYGGIQIRNSTGNLELFVGGESNTDTLIRNNMNGNLRFGTNGTERIRVTSDGNFLVGATNADVGGSVKGAIIRQNGSIVGATNISSPFHYQSPIAADRMNTMGDGVMYGLWRQGIFQAGIGATNASVMTFFTGNNDSMTEQMRITSSGNVGIGTLSPNTKLEIKGNIRLDSRSKVDTGEIDSITFTKDRPDASTGTYEMGAIRSFTYGGFAGGLTFYSGRHTGGGNYGLIPIMNIGSPTDIGEAVVQIVGTAGTLRLGTNSGDFATLIYSGGGTSLLNNWANTNAFVAVLANSVGLQVFGTGNATLTGTLTQGVSDERFKKNIELIPNALEKINSINGYTFDYDLENEDLTYIPKIGRDIGVIAQEIKQVIPEAVSIAPIDRNEEGESNSGKNYLTVNYEKIIPLLIQGIKEQQSQIEILKAEIQTLKQ